MSALLAASIILGSFGIVGFAAWNIRDVVMWSRAWLYVRFFLRYELTRCSLDAKIMERGT